MNDNQAQVTKTPTRTRRARTSAQWASPAGLICAMALALFLWSPIQTVAQGADQGVPEAVDGEDDKEGDTNIGSIIDCSIIDCGDTIGGGGCSVAGEQQSSTPAGAMPFAMLSLFGLVAYKASGSRR